MVPHVLLVFIVIIITVIGEGLKGDFYNSNAGMAVFH